MLNVICKSSSECVFEKAQKLIHLTTTTNDVVLLYRSFRDALRSILNYFSKLLKFLFESLKHGGSKNLRSFFTWFSKALQKYLSFMLLKYILKYLRALRFQHSFTHDIISEESPSKILLKTALENVCVQSALFSCILTFRRALFFVYGYVNNYFVSVLLFVVTYAPATAVLISLSTYTFVYLSYRCCAYFVSFRFECLKINFYAFKNKKSSRKSSSAR